MRVLAIALTTVLTSLALALPALAADDAPAQDTRNLRFAALDTSLAQLNQRSDDWSGSLRYRWQAARRGGAVSAASFGQFVDFKLGFTQRISPELEIGLRLSATDQARFGADAFHMFGSDQFAAPGFGLDRAYVHYAPEWAGTYSSAGEDEPALEVAAGRF